MLLAYNPALGGYIIQVEITSNMQVPCHCQHAPWHLGANARLLFLALLKTRLIILLMDMIYSTIEGIVPSRCRLTTRHLGATLFKLRLHQICKSHVAASMHHDTWGLMQSHFTSLIKDPIHHIIMSRPLGSTNCSCQQLKVQSFFHYIEESTAQLVKHKALNLVDMDSSPMMGIISYDVIFIEVYIKSQLNIILLSRPLGCYIVVVQSLHDYI